MAKDNTIAIIVIALIAILILSSNKDVLQSQSTYSYPQPMVRLESTGTTIDQCNAGTLLERKSSSAFSNNWYPDSCLAITPEMVLCVIDRTGMSTATAHSYEGRIGFPYYTHKNLTEGEQLVVDCFYPAPILPPVVNETTEECASIWSCGSWGVCGSNAVQTRTCTDANSCETPTNIPTMIQSCVYNPGNTENTNTTNGDTCSFFTCDNYRMIYITVAVLLVGIVLFFVIGGKKK